MKIVFKKCPKIYPTDPTTVRMEIMALDKLLHYANKYKTVKNSYYRRACYKAYIRFLDWSISYFQSEIGTKTYATDKLVSVIFNPRQVSSNQFARQLVQYMYVAKMYLEKLRSVADFKNADNYVESFWMVAADVEELIIVNEELRKKSTPYHISSRLGVRDSLSAYDLKQAINQLTYLPEAQSVKVLDFRNVQPCAVVIIRQALELIGRNVIGYSNICDSTGAVIKQMTQISWSFLKERLGKSTWTLSAPLQLSNIDKLNKWANAHVHNPWIQKTYIRAFGLEVLWEIMKPVRSGVKCFDGKCHASTQFGDFRIDKYNSLKADFLQYVQNKKSGAIVNWLDISQVGAYVVSL